MKREMYIENKDQLKELASQWGTFRYVEFNGQKWVARSDILAALGYSASAFFNFRDGINPENSMSATRAYLPSGLARLNFLNVAGVEEFSHLKMGRVRARKLQPVICEWLMKNLFGVKPPEPEPIIKPLFDDTPTLEEAERAMDTIFQFLKAIKKRGEPYAKNKQQG